MDADYTIIPEAEADVSEAYGWYEEQRVGLGEEFLGCVEVCLERICRNPELYAKAYKNYRRALVRRFPYVIFYQYSHDSIAIFGVFHTARKPEKWRRRLS